MVKPPKPYFKWVSIKYAWAHQWEHANGSRRQATSEIRVGAISSLSLSFLRVCVMKRREKTRSAKRPGHIFSMLFTTTRLARKQCMRQNRVENAFGCAHCKHLKATFSSLKQWRRISLPAENDGAYNNSTMGGFAFQRLKEKSAL